LFVELCISQKIDVVPVPGANSLLPALICSGFDFEKFYYYGWLSPKKDLRRKELLKLKNIKEVIVLLETPYRLKSLLNDVAKVIGKNINAVLVLDLMMMTEKLDRITVYGNAIMSEEKSLKGEYVRILNNKPKYIILITVQHFQYDMYVES